MKARLTILEALRKQAAVLKDSASGEEATEASVMEQELSERIKEIRKKESRPTASAKRNKKGTH